MSADPDPLELVQPTPFRAMFGLVPVQGPDGSQQTFVMMRVDSTSGSFVQEMSADQAITLAESLRATAERARGLLVPASGLELPNGHPRH